jgi:hypothetical protein
MHRLESARLPVVVLERDRWWRCSTREYMELIVPRGHDDNMWPARYGSPQYRAAQQRCAPTCYLCRAMLAAGLPRIEVGAPAR